jgi:phosphoglycolate phosphatase-like HAD superfamily hydrolase
MLRLIADFDGPIMDVSERYYRVYQFCLNRARDPEIPVRVLSKADFWKLKRSRTPERQIGIVSGLAPDRAREFAWCRRQTIHSLPFLPYDRVIPSSIDALEKAQHQEIELTLLTMRRLTELNEALDRCDLARFFPRDRRYCLTDDYHKNSDTHDKTLLMERALAELPPASDTWMVGDTEADIVAAKTYGIKVMAVLSGIRDRIQLNYYQPDRIVNNLAEAVNFIVEGFAQPVV